VLRARCGAKGPGPERYVNQTAFPPAQIVGRWRERHGTQIRETP
jgi:hypothetical protein